ncbi:formate/nitrite transporter family protein [Alkalicoccobacillus plakortidis]|uniref:Formate/nitrite transporter family protein n=1 Tax=Alkalicoccobacillus plakortidis TaxID=444060 RepID=A0ABT0XPP6_9BACI|nr:formate/nitrite transporter family protein [Alkalicoccobacillus plakortidis]MCM2677219.1 formate/nitrite transporter family protein [Alkalicoccobacillus plakortidis]
MEHASLEKIEQLALKKEKTYQDNRMHYLVRSILATMFLGLGVIVAFRTGGFFYETGSSLAYIVAAITFGVGILLIKYGNADLFTGNTFYFPFAALRGKMSWTSVFKLLFMTYIGNFIGAVFFACFLWATGLFSDSSVNGFLLNVASHKTETPISELFFRGILCNWLVCLAFFIPMSLKNEMAKIFIMMLLVFSFFVSGYEHSIANMCTFAIAFMLGSADMTVTGIIHNLIPVTLGNFVGGAVFMGLFFHYLNPVAKKKQKQSKKVA